MGVPCDVVKQVEIVEIGPFSCELEAVGTAICKIELMQRRPVAQQDSYMTSCTRNPELLPLSSSTCSILHDRHYYSLECETLGSSSTIDEVHNRSHQKIHNWPPRLCQLGRPRVACYSKAKGSCWRTAENKPNCGRSTTVRNSRLFPRMTSITT